MCGERWHSAHSFYCSSHTFFVSQIVLKNTWTPCLWLNQRSELARRILPQFLKKQNYTISLIISRQLQTGVSWPSISWIEWESLSFFPYQTRSIFSSERSTIDSKMQQNQSTGWNIEQTHLFRCDENNIAGYCAYHFLNRLSEKLPFWSNSTRHHSYPVTKCKTGWGDLYGTQSNVGCIFNRVKSNLVNSSCIKFSKFVFMWLKIQPKLSHFVANETIT